MDEWEYVGDREEEVKNVIEEINKKLNENPWGIKTEMVERLVEKCENYIKIVNKYFNAGKYEEAKEEIKEEESPMLPERKLIEIAKPLKEIIEDEETNIKAAKDIFNSFKKIMKENPKKRTLGSRVGNLKLNIKRNYNYVPLEWWGEIKKRFDDKNLQHFENFEMFRLDFQKTFANQKEPKTNNDNNINNEEEVNGVIKDARE